MACRFSGLAAAVSALALASAAQAQSRDHALDDPRLEELASPELTRFRSDGEFARYLGETQRIVRRWRDRRPQPDVIIVPQQDVIIMAMTQDDSVQETGGQGGDPPKECVDPDECPAEDVGNVVLVTGSRVQAPPPPAAVNPNASITHNQVLGVDEGDIVKMIGDYLLVLQDGRIFSVNHRTLALADRIDVYRRTEDGEPLGADWYDEMLVQDDQIIITAYNYEEEASEISVFRLDRATGRLTRRGVYLISSDDYYDVDNYATRVVDDQLVIYTPYEAQQIASRSARPAIRRWTPDEEYEETRGAGSPVLEASDIYRPVYAVPDPWVHTISICPLDRLEETGLECRSTGFVSGSFAEMYVGRESVYFWTSQVGQEAWDRQPDCDNETRAPRAADIALGAIFRLDIDGGRPQVIGTRGMPIDQFSFGEDDRRLRMLAQQLRTDCLEGTTSEESGPGMLALFDVSKSHFRTIWREPRSGDFVDVPDTNTPFIANRFIGDWLVYGARENFGGSMPWEWRHLDHHEEKPEPGSGRLYAIPLDRVAEPVEVPLAHQLTRLEALGEGAFVTGYRDRHGLLVDYLDLSGAPRIASTARLADRYESENRSHAFNYTFRPEGGAVMGLPTVVRRADSGRAWWWSGQSDISYLALDTAGQLGDLGAIAGRPIGEVKRGYGYRCEVSCVDWYGNARPIFIGDMIFALMGTGLVRAEIRDGQIVETARTDLTAMPPSYD